MNGFELHSLLSGSSVTCDILTWYQQMLLNQFSAIYFVHPLLFEINSQNGLEAVPNDLLPTNLNLDRFRFLFWSIPTKTKANDRWTTAVHSTLDNANMYCMDSWGSDEQIRGQFLLVIKQVREFF